MSRFQSEHLHQSENSLTQERIHFALFKQGTGLVLERKLIELDGSTLTQALPIFSPDDIERFIIADIHAKKLDKAYFDISSQVRKFYTPCQ